MECIVLEGEDDLTLEPGDVVQLVKANCIRHTPRTCLYHGQEQTGGMHPFKLPPEKGLHQGNLHGK